MPVIERLVDYLPRRTVTYRDVVDIDVRAVLRRVECRVESSGPAIDSGSGTGAIPPDWFEGGSVTAVVGAVDLSVHEWGAEPARLDLDVLFGDVTIRVPPDWHVDLRLQPIGGAARVEQTDTVTRREGDDTVHLVVAGRVWFGRVSVVGRPEDE